MRQEWRISYGLDDFRLLRWTEASEQERARGASVDDVQVSLGYGHADPLGGADAARSKLVEILEQVQVGRWFDLSRIQTHELRSMLVREVRRGKLLALPLPRTLEAAKTEGGGGGAAPTPPPGPTPKPKPKKQDKYGVTKLALPERFAPGIEKIGTYDIDDAAAVAPSAQLELFRTVGGKLEKDPVWVRALSDAERKHGHHELKWDGKIDGHSGGADFPDSWLSPAFSPYTLRITLPGGSPEKQEAKVKVEVADLALTVDAPDSKLMMNDVDRKVDVVATVKLKKTDGSGVVTPVPVVVTFKFADPGANNTAKTDSFKYLAPDKHLGKKSDAAAVHFAAHAASTSSSDDGYKTSCTALTIVADGAERGKAKICFKPSGVGGDDFKLEAAVLASNKTTKLASKESAALTVWRSVAFDKIYEMTGQTQVSTNGTTAIISPVFDPAFVRYTTGTVTAIDAAKSVKYIGLWKDATTPQVSWATTQAKTAAETPTATEIADATYAGADAALVAKRNTARTAIIAKAQAWTDRIDTAFFAAIDQWIADAAIPANALISIQYYHPKYSIHGGDAQTTQWRLGGAATPAWLRVDAFPNSSGGHYYTGLDPDSNWTNWGGLSHGSGRVTVPAGTPPATVKQVVRHEAGHATKSFFKREDFGPSLDHSVSQAGIMYFTTSGGTTFTDREKKVLRGIIP